MWKYIKYLILIGLIILTVLSIWFLSIGSNSNNIPCISSISTIDTSRFKNVIVLDPTMTNLQDKIDAVTIKHGAWCLTNQYQFGTNRVLILLKPGYYNITLYVGYYMSIAGLGKSPSDVIIDGLQVRDGNRTTSCPPIIGSEIGASTENFWRSIENLTVKNDSLWSVSQAAPARRIHFKGALKMQQSGYASGGFTSDSIFDKVADLGGNQQWFFRNSTIGTQSGCGNWNTLYLGCKGQVQDQCSNNNQCLSISDTELITVQKPTLFMDTDGKYKVLRPAPIKGAGPISINDYTKGEVFTNFYIANDTDTAATINAQLSECNNIILSPGLYKLEDSILVNKDNLMILGFGMPTLISSGKPCIIVNDVSNVTIASIIFDVGPNHTPTLLQWGTKKQDHTGYAHDIYARVGGPVNYKTSCDSMVEINSNGIIGDNFWLWRADHGVGMNGNTADFNYNVSTNGLIVNGDNVIMYGLAVEHCQGDLVLWNGENGATYWFQSEIPYDLPMGWNHYAYHVADNVKKHTGIGLGAYTFLYQPVRIPNAFKTPPSSNMKYLLTFNANSNGGFTNIWNDKGGSNYNSPGQKHLCPS